MRFLRDSEKHLERQARGLWTAHLHAYPSTVAAFLALDDELVSRRYAHNPADERERW